MALNANWRSLSSRLRAYFTSIYNPSWCRGGMEGGFWEIAGNRGACELCYRILRISLKWRIDHARPWQKKTHDERQARDTGGKGARARCVGGEESIMTSVNHPKEAGGASSKNWINMHGMASVPGRKLMCLWKSARRGISMFCQPFNSTDDLFEESGRERRENLLAVVIAHDQFNISTRSQR